MIAKNRDSVSGRTISTQLTQKQIDIKQQGLDIGTLKSDISYRYNVYGDGCWLRTHTQCCPKKAFVDVFSFSIKIKQITFIFPKNEYEREIEPRQCTTLENISKHKKIHKVRQY